MIRRLLPLLLLATPALAQAPSPKAVGCIDGSQIAGNEGESDRTILFHMQGGTTYRNTLRGACPGLAEVGRFRTLATEQYGTQLCRGDIIRAFDPQIARATSLRSFAACPLGDFTEAAAPPPRARRS